MHIAKDLTGLIGNTPLLDFTAYQRTPLPATLLGKLERCNPAGSVKDRVALAMLDDAEEKGLLKPGAVIIEPTSGNTGIGLAAIAAVRGYRLILTMPETMSVERRNLLKAYGAELVLTEGKKGMTGAIEKANELAASIPGSFIPGQFTNPANPEAHRRTTGPEIYRDTDGMVDIFVAGVGTGGTLTGVGEYLKSQNSRIQVVGVEPAGSPVLTQGKSGSMASKALAQALCRKFSTPKFTMKSFRSPTKTPTPPAGCWPATPAYWWGSPLPLPSGPLPSWPTGRKTKGR